LVQNSAGERVAAFSRIYAGWAFPQGLFREEAYRKIGLASMEDTVRFLEGYFRRRDANDLLACSARGNMPTSAQTLSTVEILWRR
jgi:hypothetical protein